MTTSNKTCRKRTLRPLGDRDLAAVTGGIDVDGSGRTATDLTVGGSSSSDGAVIIWRSVPSGI